MFANEHRLGFGGTNPRVRAPATGIATRILTGIAGVIGLTLAFTLSVVVLAAVAGVAVLAGAYIWWKTRALRRSLRERSPGGRVIEGEVVRETDAGSTNIR